MEGRTNMSESVDQEVEAIKTVLTALNPLSAKARASVLEYVVKRLDLSALQKDQLQMSSQATTAMTLQQVTTSGTPHIKDFKEQKKPRSANEMAALVAYYLANIAPSVERKATVNQKDIETHFKIAGFPLPRQVRMTLQNARTAGYFDLAGDGEYRLNAVGYNLVAHAMPRGKSGPAVTRAKPRKHKPVKPRKKRSS